jgi:prevent-host-death family protein
MAEVGIYEAKTHLPRLVERVRKGETITITKHGVPVAVLTPPPEASKMTPDDAVAAIRRLRKGVRLDGLSVRELIDDRRR